MGISEETVFRGYQLKNAAEGLNYASLGPRGAILPAWVLSSVFFAVLHADNPNATPVSTLNIALAGLMLGFGYVLTGELAIPIGLHITWNFFQGAVYGFPVQRLWDFRRDSSEHRTGRPDTLDRWNFRPGRWLADPRRYAPGNVSRSTLDTSAHRQGLTPHPHRRNPEPHLSTGGRGSREFQPSGLDENMPALPTWGLCSLTCSL